MSAKLPPEKKRRLKIIVPVNIADKRDLVFLAKMRDVSQAQIIRELVRRECQSVRKEQPKKTEAA